MVQEALDALDQWHRCSYPNPAKPLESKIAAAFVASLRKVLELAPTDKEMASSQASLKNSLAVVEAARAVVAFESFLPPVPKEFRVEDRLVELGLSFSEAEELARKSRTQATGRPPKARYLFIQALDLRKTEGLTWPAIARRLCKCDSETHERACSERIRIGAMKAKKDLGV